MFKVLRTKDGGFCIETNEMMESVTDYTGTLTFIYCSKLQADNLQIQINREIFEDGLKELVR